MKERQLSARGFEVLEKLKELKLRPISGRETEDGASIIQLSNAKLTIYDDFLELEIGDPESEKGADYYEGDLSKMDEFLNLIKK